jgi:hypothetical protein
MAQQFLGGAYQSCGTSSLLGEDDNGKQLVILRQL